MRNLLLSLNELLSQTDVIFMGHLSKIIEGITGKTRTISSYEILTM